MSYFEELTKEEQRYPYAKYVDFPYSVPPIPQDVLDKLAAPLECGRALRIEDVKKGIQVDYDADDVGYCRFEDGTGYICVDIPFPGCTKDMILWWFVWGGVESIRYKMWDPEAHIKSCVSQTKVTQRTNAALSYEERVIGTANFTVHAAADGTPDPAVMHFVSPELFGISAEDYDPTKITIVIAEHGRLDNPFPDMASIRVIREIEGGVSMKIYFWPGKAVYKGQVLTTAQSDIKGLEASAKHAAQEYQHLADILPAVFGEFSSVVDDPADFRVMPAL